MSTVNVTKVTVLDNPALFINPFQFEISYQCLLPLKHDLEWKLVYVGCAEDEQYDQILETVLVGPVNAGNYRFVLQADPPDVDSIPEQDVLGVTVILLTCSYREQEFIRVGYYVFNQYIEQELTDDPPRRVPVDKVQRHVLASKPRITRFPISFHVIPPFSLPIKLTGSAPESVGSAEENYAPDEAICLLESLP